MISYRFLSPAEEEMTKMALYYETASSRLGSDFLDDLQRTVDRLCNFPQSGEFIDSHLRRTIRFPFSIIYALEENEIVVVAVAHHGRRPGYWQSRIRG